MDIPAIAALVTAAAALLASLAQAHKLWGPRRNGNKAVIGWLKDRLDATEKALDDCLKRERDP